MSPAVFAVKAVKRGVLFPVLVNLIAVIALAGGLALFYYFFQRGETQLARGETGAITAEGKLIEQLKKESEARLLEKNQQISQIQDRLTEIDKQRQDLQATMDARVREREGQLKASLAAELETERAHLRQQGLSEQDISKRLSDIEAQKNAEFTRQLDEFRAQAEADRQKADANLKGLQDEFNASLARANQERQQAVEDSKKREAELQAQLEQKTREAASAQAQSQTVAQSESALRALQSQKEQEDLVSGQLVGLYSVVKADLSAKDYPKALSNLQAIRDYVNRADVAVLPAIQQRRDVDLFVVDSLTSFVQGQLSQAGTDTSSLVAASGQISDVRAAVAQADAQVRGGTIAEAEKLYAQALAMIPEIARSYAFFTAKARDHEDARQQALQAGLTRAEAAYETGRYPEMLAAYKDALAYLPETSARLDKILSNVSAAGSEQGRQRSLAEQTRAAAPLLRQGDAALAQGRYPDAVARYLSILDRYPQSVQSAAAGKGITNAVSALGSQADARLAAREKGLGARVAALEQQVTDRATEIAGIKKSIMNLIGDSGDPAAADTAGLMDALNRKFGDLQGAQGVSGDLSVRLATAQNNAAALQKRIDSLSAENDKLKAAAQAAADNAAREGAAAQQTAATAPSTGQKDGQQSAAQELASLKARLAALGSSYSAYTAREDPLLEAKGDQGLIDTKAYLDDFLGSKPVQETFPGLYDRIRRYDQGFLEAGRTNAIQDVLDVVIEMSRQKTADGRSRYLTGQLAAHKNDRDMTDLIKGLQGLMK